MSRFWLISKVDLMGFGDGADVGVKSFVLSKWVDGVTPTGDAGIWKEQVWGVSGVHHGHIECEASVSTPVWRRGGAVGP